MVSNAIVNHLDGTNGGLILTKGTDLFAEQGRGDQYVVVSATTHSGEEISAVRHATINVRVVGWAIMEGSMIAGRVADRILTMEGETFAVINMIGNDSQTESYRITGVTVRNWPTLYNVADKVAFTINIEMSFVVSIT